MGNNVEEVPVSGTVYCVLINHLLFPHLGPGTCTET